MDAQALNGEIGLGKLRAVRAKEKIRKLAAIKEAATRARNMLSIRGYLGEIVSVYRKLSNTHGRKGFDKNCKLERRAYESVQLLGHEMKKIGWQLIEPAEIAYEAYENAHTLNKAYVYLVQYWSAMLHDPNMPWA